MRKPTRPNTDVLAPTPYYAGAIHAESKLPPKPANKYKNVIFKNPIPFSIPTPRKS